MKKIDLTDIGKAPFPLTVICKPDAIVFHDGSTEMAIPIKTFIQLYEYLKNEMKVEGLNVH